VALAGIRLKVLISAAIVWSWISGWGVLTALAAFIGWYWRDWLFSASFIVGAIISFLLFEFVFGPIRMKVNHSHVGFPYTLSEENFLAAYRHHAKRLGVSQEVEVGQQELDTAKWAECLTDYIVKYPYAAAKFSDEIGESFLKMNRTVR
jgi:hypothetical protein